MKGETTIITKVFKKKQTKNKQINKQNKKTKQNKQTKNPLKNTVFNIIPLCRGIVNSFFFELWSLLSRQNMKFWKVGQQ